jgi:hypothetical protein
MEGVWRPGCSPAEPAPVLDSCRESENPVRTGFAGLTGHGRKWVFRAAEVLQDVKWNIRMVTFTFPPEVLDLLSQGDFLPALHGRIRQELLRRLQRVGLPQELIAVWELQPQRTAREGRPCPHLHVLMPFRRGKRRRARMDETDYLAAMQAAIETATGQAISLPPQAVQYAMVHSSCSVYLSKYLKKGSGPCERWKGSRWEHLVPRQWWMLSQALRKRTLSEFRAQHRPFVDWAGSCAGVLQALGLVSAFPVHTVKTCPPCWFLRFFGAEALAECVRLWKVAEHARRLASTYGVIESMEESLLQVAAA